MAREDFNLEPLELHSNHTTHITPSVTRSGHAALPSSLASLSPAKLAGQGWGGGERELKQNIRWKSAVPRGGIIKWGGAGGLQLQRNPQNGDNFGLKQLPRQRTRISRVSKHSNSQAIRFLEITETPSPAQHFNKKQSGFWSQFSVWRGADCVHFNRSGSGTGTGSVTGWLAGCPLLLSHDQSPGRESRECEQKYKKYKTNSEQTIKSLTGAQSLTKMLAKK